MPRMPFLGYTIPGRDLPLSSALYEIVRAGMGERDHLNVELAERPATGAAWPPVANDDGTEPRVVERLSVLSPAGYQDLAGAIAESVQGEGTPEWVRSVMAQIMAEIEAATLLLLYGATHHNVYQLAARMRWRQIDHRDMMAIYEYLVDWHRQHARGVHPSTVAVPPAPWSAPPSIKPLTLEDGELTIGLEDEPLAKQPAAPIQVLPPDQLAQLYAQLQPSPDAEIGTFCAGCRSPQVLASTRALSVTIDPATGETTQEPGEDVLHWCARCFVQRFDSVQITGATPTGEPSA